jgi:predicted PurR-regulated permease PerM
MIAILLAFVIFPLIKILDKIKCPRGLSILLIVSIIVTRFFLFGYSLFTAGRSIVEQIPQYEGRIKLVYDWIAELFELSNDEALSIWQNLWDQEAIRGWVRDITFSLSNFSFQFVSSTVLIVLFMVFILLEAGYFKTKLITAFEDRIERIEKMGNEIINQVSRYLGAKSLFSLANGIIYAVAFHLVGLQFALEWGIFQFLMNYIPTLGSISAGVVISFFALIQFWPNPTPIIIVISVILGVNLILSNLLDPKIIGEHVGISPLVTLISLSFWGYIWGVTGMFIAVPMTVIIKIICENIPMLEPVSILLGSKRSVEAKEAEIEKQEISP